jgi:hypothetical protein
MMGMPERILEGQSSTASVSGTTCSHRLSYFKGHTAPQLGARTLKPDGLGSNHSPDTSHLCGFGKVIYPLWT